MTEEKSSFASAVKEEMSRAPMARDCCNVAECSGVALFANVFSPGEVRVITSSRKAAQRMEKLFKKAFGVEMSLSEPGEGGRGKCILRSHDPADVSRIFDGMGLDTATTVSHRINFGLLEENCCRSAFLRGVFLAGGSVTDPEKGYHLELAGSHEDVCCQLLSLLTDMGFEPRMTHRGGKPVVYFKKAAAIEDFLTAAGAPSAAMRMMSVSADKDFRSAINRRVNCDSANADKIVAASAQQLEKIREIDRLYGLDCLPEDLQQVAMLRIANPEASLTDLAVLSFPPASKSGIAHRMRRLMAWQLPDGDGPDEEEEA